MKTATLQISDAATTDLLEIWLYIAEDNFERADGFIRRIKNQCEKISKSPLIGRKREELQAHLRSFPIENYMIFYHYENDYVKIVRILHGSRDIPQFFTG